MAYVQSCGDYLVPMKYCETIKHGRERQKVVDASPRLPANAFMCHSPHARPSPPGYSQVATVWLTVRLTPTSGAKADIC